MILSWLVLQITAAIFGGALVAFLYLHACPVAKSGESSAGSPASPEAQRLYDLLSQLPQQRRAGPDEEPEAISLGSFDPRGSVDALCDDPVDHLGMATSRRSTGGPAAPPPRDARSPASRELLGLLFAVGERLTASAAQSGE